MHKSTTFLARMAVVAALLIAAGVAWAHDDAPQPPDTPDTHERDAQASGDSVTYYADVEPILQANCAGCHQEGGIGHAFLSTDDVDMLSEPDTAAYIAFVAEIGYMPPWPPGEASLPFAHERTLSDEAIATLVAWADQGAPLGDESERTAVTPTNIPQIDPNVVLTMAEPYTPTGELLDDYRCFLLDPGFEEDTLITGSDFQPGNAEIAHHAIFFVVDEPTAQEAQRRSGADGRVGWECFGGTGLDRARRSSLGNVDQQALIAALLAQDVDVPALLETLQAQRADGNRLAEMDFAALGSVLEAAGVDVRALVVALDLDIAAMSGSGMSGSIGGWVPGAVPVTSPPNTGILVPAGSQIVVQMHYNLYASRGSDQSTLLLETEPFTEAMTPLNARALVAPVEIPCPAGVDNPACEREVARQDNVNPQTSNGLLAACGQSLQTYASNTAEDAYGYCDYPIPRDMWLLSVGPHMHELGARSRVVLNPGGADETILIDIPDWDFHWQGQYSFAQPVALQAGDTVRLECWWDNSEGERYIVWGEGTQDEMCFNFTRFLVPDDGKTLADYGF